MTKRRKSAGAKLARPKRPRRTSAARAGQGDADKQGASAPRKRRGLLRLLGLRRGNRRLRQSMPTPGSVKAARDKSSDKNIVVRVCKSEVAPQAKVDPLAKAEAKRQRRQQRRERFGTLARSAGHAALRTVEVIALLAVLAGLGLAGYHGYKGLSKSQYFNVDTIAIDGARRVVPAHLRAAMAPLRGQPIFRVDTALIARALERHPWIKSVQVRRDLPRTLRVIVSERDARAVLRVGSRLYLVDSDGAIFKRAEPTDAEGLPLVSGLDRQTLLSNRPRARAWLRRTLEIIATYYAQPRPPLSEVRLGGQNELTLFLRRGGTALRFGRSFSEARLRKLDAVWRALGPDKLNRLRALFLDHETRADRVIARLGSR